MAKGSLACFADLPHNGRFSEGLDLWPSAVDIAGFIAEGSSRGDDVEFARSIGGSIALASKLEYYAVVAADLEFMGREAHGNYEKEIVEVKKMMQGFRRRLICAN